MKVYISQAFDGKSYIELETERAYAIKNLQQFNHEPIDDYVRDEAAHDRDTKLSNLAEDIKKMADADAVWFLDGWEESPRCKIQHMVVELFDIKIYDPREYY